MSISFVHEKKIICRRVGGVYPAKGFLSDVIVFSTDERGYWQQPRSFLFFLPCPADAHRQLGWWLEFWPQI